MIKNLLKKLFCRHENATQIGWQEQYDGVRNIRYSVRTYRCDCCGKIMNIDGRRDPYDR